MLALLDFAKLNKADLVQIPKDVCIRPGTMQSTPSRSQIRCANPSNLPVLWMKQPIEIALDRIDDRIVDRGFHHLGRELL